MDLRKGARKVGGSISSGARRLASQVMSGMPKGSYVDWDIEDLFSEQWGKGITSRKDAFEKVAIIRKCITTLAHFTTCKGFETYVTPSNDGLKQKVDEINRLVNADMAWYIGIIKRELYGKAGFEIVRDAKKNIVMLLPLKSSALIPELDKDTMTVKTFQYGGKPNKYKANEILYFPLDPLEADMKGLSAVDNLKSAIKLKRNLEKDLLESSKRLWAPIGLYKMDTRAIPDPAKKKSEMDEFAKQLKPGRSIVHNKAVEAKIVTLSPDIGSIVRSIEKTDEEIMGAWGIPKPLLSREKSLNKATLEFSLKALYEGPVLGIQRYFKREIERQFYNVIAKDAGLPNHRIKHMWRPVALYDPALIRSLAYAVKQGAMSKREFFAIMGWDVLDEITPIPPSEKADELAQKAILDQEIEIEEVKDSLEEIKVKQEEM